MKKLLSSAILATLFALAGCTVGPNYHAPKIAMPAQWGEKLEGGATNRPMNMVQWWTNFDDAELNSLIGHAVKSNYDLQMADARLLQARAEREASEADFWPTLDANGSYTRQRQSKNAFLNGGLNNGSALQSIPLENNLYQAGFDASWEIDVFGGKRRALEAANAGVTASEFDRRDVLVSLLAEVARNYIQLRGLQLQIAIARDNIQSQQEAVDVTRARFKGGLTSGLDVQQAEALLASTQAQLPSLETALKQTMHELAVLSGEEPNALSAELSRSAPVPSIPPDVPVGIPSDLLRRRPDVRRAERQLASATALIGVQTAELFPKFSLTGGAGLESISAGDWLDGDSKFWSVGPTMQWRIFDAGRIRAGIRVRNARQKEALANYEKTVLVALQEVEDALVAYGKEQVRCRSLNNEVRADRGALAIADEQYAKGLTDFLNVLDAQRSLYQARDQLAQSQTAISENLVVLYKALGGGWNEFKEANFAQAQNLSTKKRQNYEQ